MRKILTYKKIRNEASRIKRWPFMHKPKTRDTEYAEFWILARGTWNDDGIWIDTETWND